AYLAKAGREIHLKAGQKMVIEADSELTVKAGGSFIRLDASGIAISGPLARINAGGAPGSGSGIAIKAPSVPGAADRDKAGAPMEQALTNPASPLEVVKSQIPDYSY
ncbi:type VI secretion system tip protein VgrG, partial [Pseudomonas aeruginosa]